MAHVAMVCLFAVNAYVYAVQCGKPANICNRYPANYVYYWIFDPQNQDVMADGLSFCLPPYSLCVFV